MGSTIYRQAIEEAVRSRVERGGDWAAQLVDVQLKLQLGHFSQWWVDVLGQPFIVRDYDIYDAFCFSTLHAMCLDGCIAYAPIGPIGTPHRDSMGDENNRELLSLTAPFSARFVGGPGDNDGTLQWDSNITLAKNTWGQLSDYTVTPGRAPLEVGHTAFERTLFHLFVEGGVARWPYESNVVYILLATPKLSERVCLSVPHKPRTPATAIEKTGD